MLQAQQNTSNSEQERNYGYIPIDPIGYLYPIGYYPIPVEFELAQQNGASLDKLQEILNEKDCFIKKRDRSIFFNDIPVEKIVEALPNETVSVAIKSIKANGEAKYLGTAAISKKNEVYEITADYIKFVTINLSEFIEDDSGNGTGAPGPILSYLRVGVGLRLKANITTKKKGIDVSNLFGLAIAASKEELYGTLTVSVIGIESEKVTNALPLPAEISLSSIASALQAMSTIKSKLYDNETRKIPQIISIRSVNGSFSEQELIYNTSQVLNEASISSYLLQNSSYIRSFLPNLFYDDCD